MMDAVLLKMQLLKYFDSSYYVEVGLKLHESQLHHFFQCKSSTRKKLLALHVHMNLDGGKLRNDPQNCTTDFVQNNTANVDMWQPRKHKPDPHPKLPKLMHHGHQSFYCLCHRVFLCNVRSRKNLGIKKFLFSHQDSCLDILEFPSNYLWQLEWKVLKIWWTSSLCKLSGNTLFKLQPLLLIHFPFSKIVVLNSNLTKAKFS